MSPGTLSKVRCLAIVALGVGVVWGCSSSSSSPGTSSSSGGTSSSGGSSGNASSSSSSSSGTASSSSSSSGAASSSSSSSSSSGTGEGGTCDPPQGSTCPTTAGNCYGIGKPCPNGAADCQADGLSCANALDQTAPAICVSVDLLGNKIKCKPGMKQCGAGASCCTESQGPITANVCLPNQCLPQNCTAE